MKENADNFHVIVQALEDPTQYGNVLDSLHIRCGRALVPLLRATAEDLNAWANGFDGARQQVVLNTLFGSPQAPIPIMRQRACTFGELAQSVAESVS